MRTRLLITLVLFVAGLLLVSQINFPQNDDWVYYKMASSFSKGVVKLDDISAPTFYLQGLIGAFFAYFFGIQHIPVLTLLVSVLNFWLFSEIVYKYYARNTLLAVSLGLLLFFNPLHVYSALGFMTENYYLFFLLCALYFILEFMQTNTPKSFALANLFILADFFIRQLSFVTSIAFAFYLFSQKRYRYAIAQMGIFGVLYGYYMLIFPKTAEMLEKPLELKNIWEISYWYALIYAIAIYLIAFTAPVAFYLVIKWLKDAKVIHLVLIVGITVVTYFVLNKYFMPQKLAWGEFYYLDNVLERKGFFPRGIDGNKYYFQKNFELYLRWDQIAKLLFAIFIPIVVLFRRKTLNFHLFYIAVYLAVMVVTVKVYDRYLLVILPFFILFVLELLTNYSIRIFSFTVLVFVSFLIFYTYQFSMDFVLLNKYVWNKSLELVATKNIEGKDIMGTNSWKLTNYNATHDYKYIFTFESFKTKPELKCCFTLVEEHNVTFPYSFFIEPKIYLYQRIETEV